MDTTQVAIASILHADDMDSFLCVAPEGAEGLDGAGPEDVLVVEGRDRRANHGADPEDPLHQTNQAKMRSKQLNMKMEWWFGACKYST